MTDGFDDLYRNTLIVAFAALLLLERFRTVQRRPSPRESRWLPNLGLWMLGGAFAWFVFPASVVALAAGLQPPGLFNGLGWPLAWQAVAGFLAIDLLNYGIHRLGHRHPLLWRVHLVHHTDVQVDVTTSVRHHPIESLVNAGLVSALVVAFGLPWQSVAAYAIAALVVAAWSHANVRWPARLEAIVGLVLVTPGIHLQHHAPQRERTDSNYGTVFSFWDRLFRTFTPPSPAHARVLGLEYYRAPENNTLTEVLRQPFARRLPVASPESTWLGDSEPPTPDRVFSLPPDWRLALTSLAFGLALLTPVMADTVIELARHWTSVESFRYAWLVLPLMVYAFGWHWRDEVLATPIRPSIVAGPLVVAGAAAFWVAADLLNIDPGRRLALVLILQGLVLTVFGGVFVRRWLPVLALLFYAVPPGPVLDVPLRWITNEGLGIGVGLLGLPLQTDGYWLSVGANRYFVAEACAGVEYVVLLAFLGHGFGMLMHRQLWRVLAMALLGALLGVLTNLVRVNAIVLIDQWQGTQMDLTAHGHVQWVSLLVSMSLMLLAIHWLPATSDASGSKAATPRSVSSHPLPTERTSPLRAGALAGLLGLLIGGSVSVMLAIGGSGAQALALARASDAPDALGDWQRRDAPVLHREPISGMDTASWLYQRGDRVMRVDIVQANDRRQKPSPFAMARPNQDEWRDIDHSLASDCAAPPCLPLMHITQRLNMRAPLRHSYQVYAVGDVATSSKLKLRLATASFAVRGQAYLPRWVGISVEGEALAPEEAQALMRRVLDHLSTAPAVH